jgi:site-specific recombinase XerD
MATVTLFHDTRSGKDIFPIKLRISHKNEKAYISLGIKVAPDEWDGNSGMVVGNKKAKTYNATIIARLGAANSHIANLDLLGKTKKLSASQIKEIIENGGEIQNKSEGHNFREYYIGKMLAKTKDKTRSSYEQALANLEKFDPDLKERTLEELDHKYMERFDNWFEERGVTVNSRAVYYRNIRSVFNDAVEDGMTDNYPFRRFKIKKTPTKKRNLSVEELRLLRDYPISDRFQRKYRDLFILMFYLRGINAVDLFGLTTSNIRHGRIDYIRSKTGKPYSVKIEPEMQELIDKYRGRQYLIDVCDGAKDKKEWTAKYEGFLHRMDRGLKKIGQSKRLPGRGGKLVFEPILPKLSQYWCRHTTATLMQKLGVSVDLIACSLGHDHGNKTTNIYIEYSQDEVDKANRALIDFVNEK